MTLLSINAFCKLNHLMYLLICSGLVLLSGSTAFARTFYFTGGPIDSSEYPDASYSWQISYMESLADRFAWSFSWLNEGHFPGHHRDGQVLQFWMDSSSADHRISLAAGVGPYLYYDTQVINNIRYKDAHGLGAVFSLAATLRIQGPWLFKVCANHVWTHHNPDTTAILMGIGYRLASAPSSYVLATASSKRTCITDKKNEITLFYGCSILNSFKSQTSPVAEIEYRHELSRRIDWTVGWLREGNIHLSRRNGVVTQIWPTRAFCDERITFGLGLGVYVGINKRKEPSLSDTGETALSGLVSMTASYDINPQFRVRLIWNRIVTNFNRDTDVIVAGLGYRI